MKPPSVGGPKHARRAAFEVTAEVEADPPKASKVASAPLAPGVQRAAPNVTERSDGRLATSPAGAFFFFQGARTGMNGGIPVVDVKELDAQLGPLCARLDADSPVILAGVQVRGLDRSKFADRIVELPALPEGGELTDALMDFLGQRVAILSPAAFPAAFRDALDDTAILSASTLDLTDEASAMSVRTMGSVTNPDAPVFVETFGEFPKLLSHYLGAMESIKALLVVIRDIGDAAAKQPLRQALLQELASSMEALAKPQQIARGLPPMTLADVKTNLAGMIVLARKQRGKVRGADELVRKVASLRRLIDHKHEFRLPVDGVPAHLQRQIDDNNVVLAALETEARLALVDRVQEAVAGHVDGVNLLGSAAWGAYYEVKESSDVDLEAMIGERDLEAFTEAFGPRGPNALDDAALQDKLRKGRGRLFSLARSLLDAGFVQGETKAEAARSIATKLHRFGALRQLRLDDPAVDNQTGWDLQSSAIETGEGSARLADYLSYKIVVDDVPVSLHLVLTPAFEGAARLDLDNLDRTRTLNEVRVGARKAVAPGAKEAVSEDRTVYPDKRSFDGEAMDHACPVVALLEPEPGAYLLVRPSELASRGFTDGDVAAWVTPVPAVVERDGRMFHGVFQDKVMWGELQERGARPLGEARDQMMRNLMRRLEAEVRDGKTDGAQASLLKLSSRLERIPAYSQRALLKEMAAQAPRAFTKLSQTLARAGSTELERLGLATVGLN